MSATTVDDRTSTSTTDKTREGTTLVLGGTGKTGRRVAARLAARPAGANRLPLRRAAVRLGQPRHVGAGSAGDDGGVHRAPAGPGGTRGS